MKDITKLEVLIVAVVVLILGGVILTSVARTGARSQCLSAGFPEIRQSQVVALSANAYHCVKRVNQTDTVIAVRDLSKSR